jgi:hypothetical protein
LKKLGNLDTQPDHHYTIVTVCNWSSYQPPTESVPTAKPTTNRPPTDLYNKNTTKNKNKAIDYKTSYSNINIHAANFEKFWKTYPPRNGRRVGKKAAYRYWKKIPVEEQGCVIEAAGRYAAEIGNYAKDAQRWLRDEIWRDYPSEKEEDVRMTVEELRAAEEAENERIRRMRKQ